MSAGEVIRIAMWSGPRALSTAMMRAWENRPDCVVIDEPLYAAYLAATDLDHPMLAEVLASQPQDAAVVAERVTSAAGARIVYQKHMSHHLLPQMPRDWIGRLTNAFLIRNPRLVLASYDRKRPAPALDDIGIAQQVELFEHLADRAGAPPPVIDADDLLQAPAAMLAALCHALEVPFRQEMLEWPPGPRDSDGVWAAHWYDSVWRSTGFGQPRREVPDLTPDLARLAQAAQPHYERLAAHRIAADRQDPKTGGLKPMTEAETHDLMARFGRAFFKGDVETILTCVTDDFEWRQAVGPEAPWGRVVKGKDALREALAERDVVMAKLRFSDAKVAICGDTVVGTFRISGETQDGAPADWRGCDLYEIRDGKIAYKDSYWKQIEA